MALRKATCTAALSWIRCRESRGRAAYLIITLAVAVAAWFVLASLISPFTRVTVPSADVTVMNARRQQSLPLRYSRDLTAIPGAHSIAWMNYLPVMCNATTTVTLNGYGGPGAAREASNTLGRRVFTPALEKAWNSNAMGILLGATLAKQCGWHAGTVVSPQGVMFVHQPVEVHVIGVYNSSEPFANMIALAHFDYLNRMMPGSLRNQVQQIFTIAGNPADDPVLAARIDAHFAHSDPPVKATFSTSGQNVLARFGNVQALLAFVMSAALFCAALVLASVWAHAVAERRRRTAVLQALGFSRTTLFVSFGLECLVIMLIGSGIGIGVGLAAVHFVRPVVTAILLGGYAVPAFGWTLLPAWLAALLVVSLILPAINMARTRPRDYAR